MPAERIDGKAIAATIRAELRTEVDAMQAQYGAAPGLGVVLVGERQDSATYVRMKEKAATECGVVSISRRIPDTASQVEIETVVKELNANPDVHGILVQLPLPDHIDEQAVLSLISLEKDVDGLHPENQGRLMMRGRTPLFVPCTPRGCIELLDRTKVQIEGKRAAVLGRSNIVGMPVAMLLQQRNATVTICHSKTADMGSILRECDIIIAAMGRPAAIKGEWIKPGAAVIDVGTNPVPDASKKSGFRLVGDCDHESVSQVAGFLTPVPGGVGPMTIAMLMRNTVDSAARYLARR